MKHSSPDVPHGGNLEEAARQWRCSTADILDLSTGLHPSGPPAWLGSWLAEHASLAGHYPERHGEPARSALASFLNVDPENILIAAGAQAAIEVLPQALGWKTMAIRQPCYGEPIRAALRANCQVIAVGMQQQWPSATDCIWLTSPHNPHGQCEAFPAARHGVLDESYMLFEQRQQLGVIAGVIRIGSLTKTFCIPGLRLGYIVADREYIQRIRNWLPPWPASTLAQHLLPELLKETGQRDRDSQRQRTRLMALLHEHNWQTLPSEASFVLTRPKHRLPDFASKRILVRTFDEWNELHGWIRLGLPAAEDGWQRLKLILSQEREFSAHD